MATVSKSDGEPWKHRENISMLGPNHSGSASQHGAPGILESIESPIVRLSVISDWRSQQTVALLKNQWDSRGAPPRSQRHLFSSFSSLHQTRAWLRRHLPPLLKQMRSAKIPRLAHDDNEPKVLLCVLGAPRSHNAPNCRRLSCPSQRLLFREATGRECVSDRFIRFIFFCSGEPAALS